MPRQAIIPAPWLAWSVETTAFVLTQAVLCNRWQTRAVLRRMQRSGAVPATTRAHPSGRRRSVLSFGRDRATVYCNRADRATGEGRR